MSEVANNEVTPVDETDETTGATSTTDEATDETTDEDSLTLEEKIKGVDDSSRLAPNVDEGMLTSMMSSIKDAAKSAITEARRAVNANRRWGKRDVALRASIMLPTGFPDWGANSKLYQVIETAAYADVRADIDSTEWGNLQSGKRMAIKRGILEAGIREYVARELGAEGDEEAVETWMETTEADPSLVGRFHLRIKEHYRNSHDSKGNPLAIPDRYLTPAERERIKDGKAEKDPASALASGKTGVRGLKHVVHRYAVMVLLFGLSDLVGRLAAKDVGAIEDRSHVGFALDRIADIAAYGAAVCDTSLPQDERESRKEAFEASKWTEADDEYK